MTSGDKIPQIVKETVRATAIKYQYNLWKIQVIKQYYKRLLSLPMGHVKKEKRYRESKKNHGELFGNKELLCIGSWERQHQ